MTKIIEKLKKLDEKISKFVVQAGGKIFSDDLNSARITNFFFIFFVVISLTYAFLIFALTEKINSENNFHQIVSTGGMSTPFERELIGMAAGKPIAAMVPYIARRDKRVASYMMAIAKKESNWGKFSPKKDGQECYNYWGYRGSYNQTDSGYSCFDSPRQAADVVGDRIGELLADGAVTTRDMSVWKCGYSCSWDNPRDVNKWVKDVGYYYQKIYQ